jgi:hypothetical protein
MGPFGWRRRFAWESIYDIEEEAPPRGTKGGFGTSIVLVGKTRIKFGSMLTNERRMFMMRFLKKKFV